MQNQNYRAVTTIEGAFASQGCDLAKVEQIFKDVPEVFRASSVKNHIRDVATASINGTWVPDWTDPMQKRYFIVPVITGKKTDGSAGPALSLLGVTYYHSCANVGARHVFETPEQAEYFFEIFQPQIEEYYS